MVVQFQALKVIATVMMKPTLLHVVGMVEIVVEVMLTQTSALYVNVLTPILCEPGYWNFLPTYQIQKMEMGEGFLILFGLTKTIC